MKIPRFIDEQTGVPYELYWKCTKCGWAITVNNNEIGRDNCWLCNSDMKKVRIDYPNHKTSDIVGVLNA